MNRLQRTTAIAAIGAAVLGGAAALTLGAAAGLELPDLPGTPIAAPTAEATPTEASDIEATRATDDPSSPDYHPYTTPDDPEFVPMEERAQYLGKETVIGECMAEQGMPYNVVGWWTGQDAQPKGLDSETSIRWLDAYYGEMRQDWAIQDWQRQGCLGVGTHAAEVALAEGEPLTADVPADDESLPTERQQWREFQGFIAECMADARQVYEPYDYWTLDWPTAEDEARMEVDPGFIPDQPGMPEGLTDDEKAAWSLALDGDAGAGAAYRWEDAGCSGYATHMTGNDNMH